MKHFSQYFSVRLQAFIVIIVGLFFSSFQSLAQCSGVSKQVFLETFKQGPGYGPRLTYDNGSGNVDYSTGATNYIYWEPANQHGYPYQTNPVGDVEDNWYTIAQSPQMGKSDWLNIKDHTGDANGNMLIVNASYSPGTFYKRRVHNICQNTYINFSAWFIEVNGPSSFGICRNNPNGEPIPANVDFAIYDTLGHLLAHKPTGDIHAKPDGSQTWAQYQLQFFTGAYSTVDVVLSNNNVGGCGNDLAIDDIELDACTPAYSAYPPSGNICVNNSVTFTSTLKAGYNPPMFQWYSSTDKGVTWNAINGATDSTLSIAKVVIGDNGTLYRAIAAGSVADILSAQKGSANSCSAISNSVPLKITLDSIRFGPIPSACQGGGLVDLTKYVNIVSGGAVGNGTFSSTSAGLVGTNFDPTKVLQGSLNQITYSYTNPVSTCVTEVTTNLTVIAGPAPTITAPGGTVTCQGNTIELDLNNTNAGDTIRWFDPSGKIILGARGVVYNAPSSGTYTAMVTNAGGCKGSASQAVTVNALPGSKINQGSGSAICAGSTVTLTTSTVGTAYQWTYNNKAIQGTSNMLMINKDGLYTLTVTNAAGCSDSASYYLTVHPLPTPSITYNSPLMFCPGGSVELDAGGNLASYKTLQWLKNGTPIAGATTKYYLDSLAGNYSLNVTDQYGCLGTAGPVTVTLIPTPPQPLISPSGPLTVCQGTNLTLTVTNYDPTLSYQWQKNGFALPGYNTQTYSVKVSGVYTIIATNASKCYITSASLTATVNPVPVASVGFSTLSVCTNGVPSHDQVTLTAQVSPSGTYTYQWYKNGAVSGGATTSTTYTATTSGQYYFTATSTGGCTGSASPVQVTVSPQPTPTIIPAPGYGANFCAPTPGYTYLELNPGAFGTTYSSYQWYLNGNPVPGATNAVLQVSASGNYNLQVVNASGCVGLSPVFTVASYPPANAKLNPLGPIYVCSGSTQTLTANQPGPLVWYDGNRVLNPTGTSIQVNTSGNYYYKFTDTHGCKSTSNIVYVGFHAHPPANMYAQSTSGPIKICTGNALTLHLFDQYPTDSATFEWHHIDPVSFTDNIVQAPVVNDSTYNVPTTGVNIQGNYYVVVQYVPSGCKTKSNVVNVQFNKPPIASLSGSVVCSGTPVILTSPPGTNFAWEYSAVGTAPFPWPAAPATAPYGNNQTKYAATAAGFYRVKVTEIDPPPALPCSNYTDTIGLKAGIPISVAVTPVNPVICKGDFVSLTATVSGGMADPMGTYYTYQWTLGGVPVSGGSFNTIGADQAGNWGVTVSRGGYCTTSGQTTLTVNQAPKPVITPAPQVQVCQGASQVLTVTVPANYTSYTWLRNSVPISGFTNVAASSYTVSQFGDYSVIGTATNGCIDTSAITSVQYQNLPTPSIYTTGPTIFCEGSTTRIYADSTTASGAPTTNKFKWAVSTTGVAGPFTNITGATFAGITIGTAGYYQVTETTSAGCADSAGINIQTFPVTAPVISGTLFFCDSSSTTLTSNITTPGAFEWDYQTVGNYISDQPSIAVTQPGVYILLSRNTSNANCYKTTSVSVVRQPLPVAAYTMADSCETTNTVTFVNTSSISDNSTLAYSWDFGDPASGASNTSTATTGTHTFPPPIAPTTYQVALTATSPSGCSRTYKQGFFFKGSKPVASFTVAGGKICAGQPTTLQDNSTITTGTIQTYAWSIYYASGQRAPLTIDSVPAPVVTLPDSSTDAQYTVFHTVIGSSGCLDITSQVLTSTGTMKAHLKLLSTRSCVSTAPDSLRGGTPVNGTGGGIGAYSGPGVKSGMFYPAIAGVGKHTIVYTFLNPSTGCASTASDTINVEAAPAVVNLSAPPTYKPCDTSVLLTASGTGATLYNWYVTLASGKDSLLASGPSDTLRISLGGNYRVRISNQYGCYSDATIPITLYPHPKPAFDLSSICSNLIATFTNTSTISDGSGMSYQWDFGDPASGVNNTTTSQAPVHQYTGNGTKSVTLTATSNKGCVQTLVRQFMISNIDSLVNFNIRTNSPFCVMEPIVFIDSTFLPNRSIRSYRWIFLDAMGNTLNLTQPGDTTALISVVFPNVTAPTKFTVREMVVTTDGCPLQGKDRTIIINPKTPLTYVREHGRNVCRLDPPFPLTGGSTVPPGQPGKGYYTGAGVLDSATFNPLNVIAGDNTVTYVFNNQYGCQTTASTEYTVHDTLALSPRVTNFNVLEGDQVTLNGIGTLPFTFGPNGITSINADSLKWQWTPGTGLSSTTVPVPTLTAGVTTTYTLSVTPPFGCPSRALFVVVVHKRLHIPNAFSPNGDGNNDTWIIQGIDNYPNVEVFLFNRWGQQLWHSRGYGTPWDGFYNGKPLPMGTYYYLIKLNKVGYEQPLSGPLTIIY